MRSVSWAYDDGEEGGVVRVTKRLLLPLSVRYPIAHRLSSDRQAQKVGLWGLWGGNCASNSSRPSSLARPSVECWISSWTVGFCCPFQMDYDFTYWTRPKFQAKKAVRSLFEIAARCVSKSKSPNGSDWGENGARYGRDGLASDAVRWVDL